MGLSEEKILENKDIIEKLIAQMKPDAKRKMVQNMFEQIGEEFFLAPASSKEEYHGCFPGGLADHSLRVVTTLIKITNALVPARYSHADLVFLGLMHDLGKVGDVGVPLYVPNEGQDNAWKRKKGWLYDSNKELQPYMPVCDRTMFLLNKFGIPVSAEEYVAIRVSDGPAEKSNEKYTMKEPDLALLLHMADRWACALEKQS